jgi:hypothetical protein
LTRFNYSAVGAAKEALWLKNIMRSCLLQPPATPIKTDSAGCLNIIKNPIISAKTKHIDVLQHVIKNWHTDGLVVFFQIGTAEMVADCLTKAVPKPKFLYCIAKMGMTKSVST